VEDWTITVPIHIRYFLEHMLGALVRGRIELSFFKLVSWREGHIPHILLCPTSQRERVRQDKQPSLSRGSINGVGLCKFHRLTIKFTRI
jgi:hypothetical protein